MRYGIVMFLFATLSGCTHISHQDPKTGMEVTYTGPARRAVDLVHAADPRVFDLASEAMDNGMATSLARDADGDVRFNAGYGYTYGATSVGGYAIPNTSYVPGQGFVVGPPMSTLPPLATSVVVTGMPTQSTDGEIVPCPADRPPANVAEQAACAAAGVRALTQSRVE